MASPASFDLSESCPLGRSSACSLPHVPPLGLPVWQELASLACAHVTVKGVNTTTPFCSLCGNLLCVPDPSAPSMCRGCPRKCPSQTWSLLNFRFATPFPPRLKLYRKSAISENGTKSGLYRRPKFPSRDILPFQCTLYLSSNHAVCRTIRGQELQPGSNVTEPRGRSSSTSTVPGWLCGLHRRRRRMRSNSVATPRGPSSPRSSSRGPSPCSCVHCATVHVAASLYGNLLKKCEPADEIYSSTMRARAESELIHSHSRRGPWLIWPAGLAKLLLGAVRAKVAEVELQLRRPHLLALRAGGGTSLLTERAVMFRTTPPPAST